MRRQRAQRAGSGNTRRPQSATTRFNQKARQGFAPQPDRDGLLQGLAPQRLANAQRGGGQGRNPSPGRGVNPPQVNPFGGDPNGPFQPLRPHIPGQPGQGGGGNRPGQPNRGNDGRGGQGHAPGPFSPPGRGPGPGGDRPGQGANRGGQQPGRNDGPGRNIGNPLDRDPSPWRTIGPPQQQRGNDGKGGKGNPWKRPLPKALQNIPLSGEEEHAVAMIEDELAQTLNSIGIQRDQLRAVLELTKERLGTNQGFQEQSVNESMADRGLFDSGVRTTDLSKVGLEYDRQRQDVGSEYLGNMSELTSGKGEAYNDYYQNLIDILTQAARTADLSRVSPGGGPGRKRRSERKDKKKKKGRR